MSAAPQTDDREALLAQLKAARDGDAPRPLALSMAGMWLVDADLSGVDLSGYDLSGADLSRANLAGAKLIKADLRGATLFEADLSGAELMAADLREAELGSMKAPRSGFGQADLRGARGFGADLSGASLTGAKLEGSEWRTATLAGARLREADLTDADFTGADLSGADLERASVRGVSFHGADMRRCGLREVTGYTRAEWVGADLRDVNFSGAMLLRRFALDQQFIEEFRTQSPLNGALYKVWWLTSDCGRSFSRWGLWTVLIAVTFAGIYTQVGIDWGDYETPLSPLYYSLVTLSTLGYGDVLPSTVWGQVAAMAQVVLGYVMLGGLMSIFSNKMARRAD